MSSPIYIPSSASASSISNPVSVSVITSSYTVPAGKFAQVHYNLEGASTITVNGATASRGTSNTVLGSDNISLGPLKGDGNFNSYRQLITSTWPGAEPASSSVNYTGTAFNESTDNKTVVGDLFLPSGTVISGSGTWRATVMIYNA